MAGSARGCAVPKLTRGAHNFKITPVHCNRLTYGHLTSEVYHDVLFYDVNILLVASREFGELASYIVERER